MQTIYFCVCLAIQKGNNMKNNENRRDHTFLESPLKIVQFVLPIAFYSQVKKISVQISEYIILAEKEIIH